MDAQRLRYQHILERIALSTYLEIAVAIGAFEGVMHLCQEPVGGFIGAGNLLRQNQDTALDQTRMDAFEQREPVAWRGPMLLRALEQFLPDVYWGDLDVLLLDLPPAAGVGWHELVRILGAEPAFAACGRDDDEAGIEALPTGLFIAEPFEKGFGTTVGNGLRRVLLSSIEGTASFRSRPTWSPSSSSTPSCSPRGSGRRSRRWHWSSAPGVSPPRS